MGCGGWSAGGGEGEADGLAALDGFGRGHGDIGGVDFFKRFSVGEGGVHYPDGHGRKDLGVDEVHDVAGVAEVTVTVRIVV